MGEPTDDVSTAVFEGGPMDGFECPVKSYKIKFPGQRRLLSIPEMEAAGLLMVPPDDPRWNAHRTPTVTYADTGRRTADGRRVFAVEG